jgi:hypothetical protein
LWGEGKREERLSVTHLVITLTTKAGNSISGYREWTAQDVEQLNENRRFFAAEPSDHYACLKLAKRLFNEQRLSFHGADNGWTICGHNVGGALSADGYVWIDERLVENYDPSPEDIAL